jgi:hypothetical protein
MNQSGPLIGGINIATNRNTGNSHITYPSPPPGGEERVYYFSYFPCFLVFPLGFFFPLVCLFLACASLLSGSLRFSGFLHSQNLLEEEEGDD